LNADITGDLEACMLNDLLMKKPFAVQLDEAAVSTRTKNV
jgi:hypothetical protein